MPNDEPQNQQPAKAKPVVIKIKKPPVEESGIPTDTNAPTVSRKPTASKPAAAKPAAAAKTSKPAKSGKPPKKPTKEQLRQLAASSTGRPDFVSATLKHTVDSYREKKGDESTISSGVDTRIWFPLPSLAEQYLYAMQCFPLARILHLFGTWGSGKTLYLYYLFHLFIRCGGSGYCAETENKENDFFWDNATIIDGQPCAAMYAAQTTEQWQRFLMKTRHNVCKALLGTKEAPGPGPIIPHIFGLDSLAAALSSVTQKDILEEGHAKQRYGLEPRLNSDWLKTFNQAIRKWPFLMVFVNHMTESMTTGASYGAPPPGVTKGGKNVNFGATIEVEFAKRGSTKVEASGSYSTIGVRVHKNSFGPNNRKVVVDILFTQEEILSEDGSEVERVIPHAEWLWHEASIDLLLTLNRSDLNDIITIGSKSCGSEGKKFYAPQLGVKSSDPVPKGELGRMIMRDEKILEALHHALKITRAEVYEPIRQYLAEKGEDLLDLRL